MVQHTNILSTPYYGENGLIFLPKRGPCSYYMIIDLRNAHVQRFMGSYVP